MCQDLFADNDDFTWLTIAKRRNIHFHKQVTYQLNEQIYDTMRLLTHALSIHLNVDQHVTINTSSIFMQIGRLMLTSLNNHVLQRTSSTRIHLPSNIHSNLTNDTVVLYQVCHFFLG
jgi:hypothetical protein